MHYTCYNVNQGEIREDSLLSCYLVYEQCDATLVKLKLPVSLNFTQSFSAKYVLVCDENEDGSKLAYNSSCSSWRRCALFIHFMGGNNLYGVLARKDVKYVCLEI